MEELTLIAAGAEAYLYKGKFLGFDVIIKYRAPKSYRDPRLDRLIRYERTLTESRIMQLVRCLGIYVPAILYVDPEKALIVMEYVKGTLLRDLIPSLNAEVRCEFFKTLGTYVGKMHMSNIIHGDLTTSNIIICNNTPYIIDFGLSRISDDTEDKGVDIHLMLRSLESTHYSTSKELFKCFTSGYGGVVGDELLNTILSKVREIRLRGRYIEERRLKH